MWEMCIYVQKVFRSFVLSLRVVVIGSCVISGACLPTEVMRVLSVVIRVVRWGGARLVRWIRVVIFETV